MKDGGEALMGIGQAGGEKRAIQAANSAISSPLLEIPINGAKKVLLNVIGGLNLTLMEVDEAVKLITEAADPEADIIVGQGIDDSLGDAVRITVIATCFTPSKNITPGKSQPGSRQVQQTGAAGTLTLEDIFDRNKRSQIPGFRTISEPTSSNSDLPPFLRSKLYNED
jgi:cell division GTPase FtsZ